MERIPRAVLDRQVVRVGRMIGREIHLDYAACYGGYKVVETATENDIFGAGRMSAREMNRALNLVEMALDYARQPLLGAAQDVVDDWTRGFCGSVSQAHGFALRAAIKRAGGRGYQTGRGARMTDEEWEKALGECGCCPHMMHSQHRWAHGVRWCIVRGCRCRHSSTRRCNITCPALGDCQAPATVARN